MTSTKQQLYVGLRHRATDTEGRAQDPEAGGKHTYIPPAATPLQASGVFFHGGKDDSNHTLTGRLEGIHETV